MIGLAVAGVAGLVVGAIVGFFVGLYVGTDPASRRSDGAQAESWAE